MALVVKDRVQVSSSTTGTGTLTLGVALGGFQDFSVIGDGNTTYYAITNNGEWEVGIGTYTASGTTLSRDTVLESSNSGNKINLSGTSLVFCTYPAEKGLYLDANGNAIGLGTPASVNLTNATNLPLTTGVTGVLPEANGGTGTTVGYNGFKNRIINGAMQIDQRNAGASITNNNTGTQYSLDRWLIYGNNSSKFTVQQNAGSVTPPAGFSNYLGVTSSAATTVGSGDIYEFIQYIEGFNTADLAWGTANAQTVTVSFWVRSSLTGTFGGALQNSGATRSYPFSYTISAANTWEQKSITIAGDTTGTWLTNNGTGISLVFSLGMGSTYSSTAGSWQAGLFLSATGATSVVGTNGATFYITGVQLEKGSQATAFEWRSYGTELALAQRYYWRIYAGAANQRYCFGQVVSTTQLTAFIQFPVLMRTSPTALEQSGTASDYLIAYQDTASACSSVPTFSAASVNASTLTFTVGSGLTVGQAAQAASNSANSYLGWSAEL
jgi:hypothetical protein